MSELEVRLAEMRSGLLGDIDGFMVAFARNEKLKTMMSG